MQIREHQKDKLLICRFKKHEFELERSDEKHCFKSWYMLVKNDAGEICCDGWIDDSSGLTARGAMERACDGAMIDPPKIWPKGIL